MIPLFIRGSEHDPRTKTPVTDEHVPNRPIGHRPEPQVKHSITLMSCQWSTVGSFSFPKFPLTFLYSRLLSSPLSLLCPGPVQQQTAGAGITNINGQLNAQFGGMSFTAGFGFFPSLFGLQFQVSPILAYSILFHLLYCSLSPSLLFIFLS